MLNRVGVLAIAAALVCWSSAALAQTGYSGASSGGVACGPGPSAGPCVQPTREGQTAAMPDGNTYNRPQQYNYDPNNQWPWDRGHYPTEFTNPGS